MSEKPTSSNDSLGEPQRAPDVYRAARQFDRKIFDGRGFPEESQRPSARTPKGPGKLIATIIYDTEAEEVRVKYVNGQETSETSTGVPPNQP